MNKKEYFVKCRSYCEEYKNKNTYDKFTGLPDGQYSVLIERCNGTREREECSCGGNRLKCTHYPENREEAIKQLAETLVLKEQKKRVKELMKDIEDKTKNANSKTH